MLPGMREVRVSRETGMEIALLEREDRLIEKRKGRVAFGPDGGFVILSRTAAPLILAGPQVRHPGQVPRKKPLTAKKLPLSISQNKPSAKRSRIINQFNTRARTQAG
jgi:hypothetical protein